MMSGPNVGGGGGKDARSYGWYSGAWQKNPLVIGYTDVYREFISELNALAGTNLLNGSTVPAGEIWVVTHLEAVDVNNAPSLFMFRIVGAPSTAWLIRTTALTANESVTWTGRIVLVEGDNVRGQFQGVTLNDNIYMSIWGWKIAVDQ